MKNNDDDTNPQVCISCGYDLRGSSSGGRCPECGQSVDLSRPGYYLDSAPVDWLEKILKAVNQIIVTAVVMVTLWVFCYTCLVIVPAIVTTFLKGFAVLAGIDALMKLTTADARLVNAENHDGVRRKLRGNTLVIGSTVILFLAFVELADFMGIDSTNLMVLKEIQHLVFGLSAGALIFGSVVYLAHLANWMPDSQLGADIRNIGIRFTGCAVGVVLFAAAARLTAQLAPSVVLIMPFSMLVLGCGAGALWYLGHLSDVLGRYRKRIVLAIQRSRTLHQSISQTTNPVNT